MRNDFDSVDVVIPTIDDIDHLDSELECKFSEHFQIELKLSRSLVSFQANKNRRIYRWYKYKEAFSASMVEFLLKKYGVTSGKLFDPFAGIGTALFASSVLGMDAEGIELLPIGQKVISARLALENEFTEEDISTLEHWLNEHPWVNSDKRETLQELRITAGAYPLQTKEAIERYMGVCRRENQLVQSALLLALLSVLESVSYTRKDGQYLRWDYRAGRRRNGKRFDKGKIFGFNHAISGKLKEILSDIRDGDELFPTCKALKGQVRLIAGSCLEEMPKLQANLYDVILTSPPYCNRYDYTRTYALELALLGLGEGAVSELRQQMLTCTVENRAKDLIEINPKWKEVLDITDNLELLQSIILYLEDQRRLHNLNNNSIPRMVRGYFYEMACIITENFRVLKPGGILFMINDNVRYAGVSISVDMILSDIAEKVGFTTENILVLSRGKGNSSQQMGTHGRKPLRKCVYVWRKRK